MRPDPQRYYAILNVALNASTDEIRTSYRRLAKECHPDLSREHDAAEKFKQLNHAYNVLSNSAKRAAYDSAAIGNTQWVSTRAVDPVSCDHCKHIILKPKYYIFIRAVGYIFGQYVYLEQGAYCRRCARRLSLTSTFICGVVGWWCPPDGMMQNFIFFLRNAAGGLHSFEIDEELQWKSAVWLYQHREYRKAMFLAKALLIAIDPIIAADAHEIVSNCAAKGYHSEDLVEIYPKTKSALWLIAHLLAIMAGPALILAVFTVHLI